MRIGPTRVEGNRNFATKLWNAARFCEMNGCVAVPGFDPASVTQTVNRWIVGETADAACDDYRVRWRPCASTMRPTPLYQFVWAMFCDWYLELDQTGAERRRTKRAKAETRATAAWVRDQILKLLHPFMPFITEELWARTAGADGRKDLLIVAPWPDFAGQSFDPEATTEMNWVIELVSGVRSVRAEMNVPASAKIALVLKGAGDATRARLERNHGVILTLARLASAEFSDSVPQGSAQFVPERRPWHCRWATSSISPRSARGWRKN